jgi:hypothetical protein
MPARNPDAGVQGGTGGGVSCVCSSGPSRQQLKPGSSQPLDHMHGVQGHVTPLWHQTSRAWVGRCNHKRGACAWLS